MTLSSRISSLLAMLAITAAAGCTGTPIPLGTSKGSTGAQTVAQQLSAAQTINGVRVSFHYSDYYSLTAPNSEGCAGDARNFYDPIALSVPGSTSASYGFDSTLGVAGLSAVAGASGPTGPLLLPQDVNASDQTIRPSFIKNISVDMTDANAAIANNQAGSCSLGQGGTVPATSSCATFDYGAIGGVPSTLGGTMLVIGGVQNYNYSGRLPTSQQVSFPFQGMSLACGTVTNAATTASANTQCNSGVYALGVDTLPASAFSSNPAIMPSFEGTAGPTGAVSMWANISGAQGYTGPAGGAGASAAYDTGLQKVLLFGGVAPLTGLGSNAPGVTTYDTWSFDLKSQHWTYLSANIYITSKLMTLYDMMLDYENGIGGPTAGTLQSHVLPVAQQPAKSIEGRAVFGYVAAPGMGVSLDALNTTGTMTSAMIDHTDRLLVVGGIGSSVFTGTHRFNPTYGPEIQNIISTQAPFDPSPSFTKLTAASANLPVQWIDSYHTQLMNNTYGAQFVPHSGAAPFYPYTDLSSRFTLDLPPINVGPTGGQSVINSAFAPLVNNGVTGVPGTGYVLAAGGFDASSVVNAPDTNTTNHDDISVAVCLHDSTHMATTVSAAGGGPAVAPYGTNTTLGCGGGMAMQTRFYSSAGGGALANEALTSDWSAVTNFLDSNSLPNTPALWTQLPESRYDDQGQNVPFLGGATMLPGFDLSQNEVAYFGGIDCRGYVADSSTVCTAPPALNSTNAGRYWRFGNNPASHVDSSTVTSGPVPPDLAAGWNGTSAPTQAGMAAARGLDPAGKVIMLAWGGAYQGAAHVEGSGKIYYLFDGNGGVPLVNLGLGGTPQWGFASPSNQNVSGSIIPAELINASMVFSHVTKKFYVFGGYDNVSSLSRGDTYELSLACTIDSVTHDCVVSSYHFTWRQLDQSTGIGLTCYPSSCPPARRSHRMAEVNYFNRNPGGSTAGAGYTQDGEQPCAANAPCSYGLFMEGGTSDGFNYLSDRWMFDPTANGGAGHWQKMGEFPPRTLASMTAVDYALPLNGQVVHRAILFGGETGLHNAQWAPSGYFVPPTLGDTWMFDYDNQSWNRVELLGKGYNGAAQIPGKTPGIGTEADHRQGFDATAPGIFEPTDNKVSPAVALSNEVGAAYSELSPPALAGAIMVTRTQAPPVGGASSATTPLRTLAVPEVYMFGGRLKSGAFSTMDRVYKFCAGSTGEAFTFTPPSTEPVLYSYSVPNPQDFTCDAFDPVNNSASPSPSAAYVGRWLTKKPDGVTSTGAALNVPTVASYLGAGAYDPIRDRIVTFGGLTSAALGGTTAVTDSANLIANPNVYEYTPPQPQLGNAALPQHGTAAPREGRWTYIPACSGYPAPVGRYGHSMAYNTLGQNIILMGGYDASGTPLTTNTLDQSANRTYSAPEVWTGTYCADATCGGKFKDAQPAITLNNAPCYYWEQITLFGNSTVIQSQQPPQTGLAHAAAVFIPATGFNTGYYGMFDEACANEGPIASPDPSLNKLLAGGAYIDIDRSVLGPNENVLLNITYMPMGTNNLNPDGTHVSVDQSAVFRVHLIKTGQTAQQLEAALQPRYMSYSDPQQYAHIVESLSVMAPPTGQMAQEQIMVPLSIDPGIDRIRIERYSGSGILLDASVYRMGSK